MPSDKAGKVIFIGNIPYGLSEEQIISTFSQVGTVVSFRLVHDKETSKPKGFGFMEFADADMAASAVRNLNDTEIMNRRLRVDWSNESGSGDNPPSTNQTQSQHRANGSESNIPPQAATVPPLPPGAELPPGVTCHDQISRTLATLSAPQLLDLISQMKGLSQTDPAKATALLKDAPQLSYAIFQSLLLLGLVDQSALAAVINQPQAPPPQVAPAPAIPQSMPPMPSQYAPRITPQQPPPQTATPPVYGQGPPPPPPPNAQLPPQIAGLPVEHQQALIQQLLSVNQASLAAMDPNQQALVLQLRQQLFPHLPPLF